MIGQELLHLGYSVRPEVKDAGRQGRVGGFLTGLGWRQRFNRNDSP